MPVTYLNIKYKGVTIRGKFYLEISIWNAGTLFYKYISMLFKFLHQPENTRPSTKKALEKRVKYVQSLQ